MATDSSLSFIFMSMYEMMGNTISLQYGGSEAHSVFFDRKKGGWEATTQSKVIVRLGFVTTVMTYRMPVCHAHPPL